MTCLVISTRARAPANAPAGSAARRGSACTEVCVESLRAAAVSGPRHGYGLPTQKAKSAHAKTRQGATEALSSVSSRITDDAHTLAFQRHTANLHDFLATVLKAPLSKTMVGATAGLSPWPLSPCP